MRPTIACVCGIGMLFVIGSLAAGPPGSYPTVTVPLYGAGLAQAPAPAPGDVTDVKADLKRIEEKLDRLLKLLEDAAKDDPSGPAKAPGSALSSGATKCAACHFPDVAEQKGGGFKLFTAAGAFAQLTPRQRTQVVKRVTTADPSFLMPPPKSDVRLTDAERAALVSEFDAPR